MKYNKKITERICYYIEEGDSQKIAAQKAGVSESQFYEWKKKSEFSEAIKKAKDKFLNNIVNKLEVSLWKKATGYEFEETEAEYTADADGNPKIKTQKVKKKHIAPDTGALIFALTNLCPERWVNKQRTEIQTEEIEKTDKNNFEDLPEDLLFEIADKIQAEQHKKVMENKQNN